MTFGIFHDELAVDQGRSAMLLAQQMREIAEAVGPVEPASRQQFDAISGEAGFNAIAVEFDFVNPLVALGRLRHQRCKTRFDECRKRLRGRRLSANCRCGLSWPRGARRGRCFG